MGRFGDPDESFVARVRPICLALPDAYEEQAWAGTRWLVRKKTFAHVVELDDLGPSTVVTFRSQGDELDALRHAGHPYFYAGWGRDVVGMVLDEATDWDEVAELLTESYCVLAPQKLVALVERPPEPGE
ncbi:MAG TPA: MmcQ/YjbR family DNA-binding protein [Acidimicrobiales bacterium]|nr:MmcQ/YjbR family DNA-binding protein [Acidimicrobiales bacterium]